MSNFTVDPNTGINVPTVGVDPGPDYAGNISAALTKLSALTHTGASNQDGLQIPSAGININADLSAQSHNLTALRSTRFTSQSGPLVGVGDVSCVYFRGGDLWINDGAGTPVQLTVGGTPVASTSTNFIFRALSANHTVNQADTDSFFSIDTTSAAVVLTLPAIANVVAGRFYYVKDRLGTSLTHPITITPAGADTIEGAASYVMADLRPAILLVADGVGNWLVMSVDRNVISGNVIVQGDLSAQNLSALGNLSLNSGGKVTFGGTRTFVRNFPLTISTFTAGAPDWIQGGIGWLQQANVTCFLQGYARIPNGSTIIGAKVYLKGAAAHAALPTLPVFNFAAYNVSTGVSGGVIAIVTDTSASTAAYQAQHSISLGTLSTVINNATSVYIFTLQGEHGANYVNALGVSGVEVTYTNTLMDDGEW